eukprot:TRINITY_DN23787_c0_g1_i1.p1 TRINITY_DN23787_c0_g1~~TRINITY_DN23787_c0_g1_i1.p1  ORF type:complete len:663 (+),score=122.89 TRINITY_DN23787_c0_g1_i1:74-2062(+)
MARMVMSSSRSSAQVKPKRHFGLSLQNDDETEEDIRTHWTELRKSMDYILSLQRTDWVLTGLILLSFVVIVVEANLTARILTDQSNGSNIKSARAAISQELLLVEIATKTFSVIYCLEMLARLYVYRSQFLRRGWGMDGAIVFIDVLMSVLDATLGNHPSLTFARVFRLARLLRFVRILNMFPELSFLLRGMASSMRAIIFGTILVYVMITMWAVVGVYWIHPVNIRVMEKGAYEAGDRSIRAWSSVQNALVTLAQTVIFGDSWGATAIPIIEESPDTIFFFVAMYSTVALATLNLILAAIVDSGAQAREEAMEERKRKKEASMSDERRRKQELLLQVCSRLDDDDSGSLSMDEIQAGFDRSKEFKVAMEEFELDRRYIDIFFNAMDEHGQGVIDYQEFIRLVDMSRTQASGSVLTFVKFAIIDARRMIAESQTSLMREIECLKQIALTTAGTETGSEQQPKGREKLPPKGDDKQQTVARRATLQSHSQTNGGSMSGQTNGVVMNGQRRHTVMVPSDGKPTSVRNSQSRRRTSTNGQTQGAGSKQELRPARNKSAPPELNAEGRSPSPKPNASLGEGALQELVELSREVADGMKSLLAAKVSTHSVRAAGADCDPELPQLPSEDDAPRSPNGSASNGNLFLLEHMQEWDLFDDDPHITSLKC